MFRSCNQDRREKERQELRDLVGKNLLVRTRAHVFLGHKE